MFIAESILFSNDSIPIIILCDLYKRKKTLTKKTYQKFARSRDRKRQQTY